MSPELDEKLVKAYPILFGDRYKSEMETCMCWGFECSDGWYDLIEEASRKLEAINAKITDPKQRIIAAQVKEKFGTLRFYIDGAPEQYQEEVYAIIDEAERKSGVTCESCGKAGKVSGPGWIRCLCDECRGERQKK